MVPSRQGGPRTNRRRDIPRQDLERARPLIDTFDARRAGLVIGHLCRDEFGGRRVGTAGHDAAQAWLVDHMHRLGLRPAVQSFPVEGVLDLFQAPSFEVLAHDGTVTRCLEHRLDFAEHLRSPLFTRPVTGRATRWSDKPVVAEWAILSAVPQGDHLHALAERLATAQAAGVLTPQLAGSDGYLTKRIVGGPPVAIPMVAVRPDVLRTLDGATVRIAIPMRRASTTGGNVIGLRPGTDLRLKDEPLLLTAHFDGVGDDPGRRLPAAGDNASGVAVILEVARALRRSRRRPRRPVMFAALDAEEIGAPGSRVHASALAEAGVRPLVLNVDMVGRFSDAVVAELGPGSDQLAAALDQAGQWLETPLLASAVASDNRSYAAAGFAATGLALGARSYHTPSDTLERVDATALEMIGRLLLAVIWLLAFEGLAG